MAKIIRASRSLRARHLQFSWIALLTQLSVLAPIQLPICRSSCLLVKSILFPYQRQSMNHPPKT